jgi:PncC family amidohydrolase
MKRSKEQILQQKMIEKGLTFSVAESCTGGAFSARLTALPDCSRYFLGAVVSYANSLKVDLLGVPKALIDQHGAVSREVAEAMAEGIFKKTGSSWSAAITGIAGPTGAAEKPVGTVWMAIKSPEGEIKSFYNHFSGDRQAVVQQSVEALLDSLLRHI